MLPPKSYEQTLVYAFHSHHSYGDRRRVFQSCARRRESFGREVGIVFLAPDYVYILLSICCLDSRVARTDAAGYDAWVIDNQSPDYWG